MQPNFRICAIAVFLSICFASVQPCHGQALTGDILGTVTDSSGAVIRGARVTLRQVGSGETHTATTDVNGSYRFAELQPAHYSLSASKASFEETSIPDIELLVAQRQRINIILLVGSTTEHVKVSAGTAQLLETQNAELGQVVQEKPIVELPLNGRDFVQLATLSPGVYPGVLGTNSCASAPVGATNGTVNFNAMGLRDTDISYLIDGIETRGARYGNATIRPSPDAIEEFKVQTQNYGAENGRSAVVVNLAIKSGTNTFHGSAYEFIRNSAFDANNFFLSQSGVPKPGFQQNDFGASIGGPIVKNKTFFFGNFEGIRSLEAESLLGLYPSAAQLAGNLADNSTGTGIFPTSSPFCQANSGSSKCVNVINPYTGVAFPNNQIPKNMLDPIAQKWLPYINSPNVAGATNSPTLPAFNFTTTPKQLNNADLFTIKIDHELNREDHLSGSYTFDQRPHFVPGLAILGGQTFPWRGQILAVSETHVFSPTVVNEFHFGYSRSVNAIVSQTAYGPNTSAAFGFENIPDRPIGFGIPGANISGYGSIGSYGTPQDTLDRTFQFNENLSIARGKHTLKMGGTYNHEKWYYLCDCAATPSANFTGQFTNSSLGDFLLGIPYSAVQSVGNGVLDTTANFYSGYFQDDIRLRPDLTLNLGVRYEYQQSPQAIDGREETWNPSTGQIEAVFRDQIRNGIVKPGYNDWGPRVGIAYSPFKSTVVRAGFGIYYTLGNWNEFGFAISGPDFIIDEQLISDPTKPTLPLASLFPPVTLGPQLIGPDIGIYGVDPNNRTPYIEEWNLDVQHAFGANWLLDIGYAGNEGQHLYQRRDDNSPPFNAAGVPVAQGRPYPDYNFITESSTIGWSSYNALLARLEKKVSANSFLLASYTWSHAIDTYSPGYGIIASRDFKFYNRGNDELVTPQRLSVAYSYSLPFGRNMRFVSGASGVVGKVVSGWTASAITSFQSGQYQTPTIPFDYVNLGPYSTSLANRIGPVTPAHRTINNWWNINAFALPGCPSINACSTEIHLEGDAGKGSIENGGMNDWDISLEKNTTITERTNLQFRAEFFNAWNHPQWGPPNGALIPGVFGQVTSLLVPPREIQFALKLIF
jgi:Carboxypeptidase regulatory-like domain/TonB dependent receptor